MLYLKEPTKLVLDEYFNKIEKKVLENINSPKKNSFLNIEAKEFLKVNLSKIIQTRPEELKGLNEDFFKKLNKYPLTYNNYLSFLRIKNKKEADRSQLEKLKLSIYFRYFKKIDQIFDYDSILSKSQSKSYWLSKKMGVNTCVYCNRLYANVIEVDGGTNNDKRIARPFFDHWYPKSKYPILSLSFYNLIPSCFVCNSSIKGSLEFNLETHLHPYDKKNDTNFKFSYNYNSDGDPKVIIRDFKTLNDKTIKTIEAFKIKEVYDSHSHLELKDLIDLANKYPGKYLKTLFNDTFKDLKMSDKEIYRMIFGIEIKEEDYHKRPFSKFKHDIIEELRQIK
jgi:hypothetical protein